MALGFPSKLASPFFEAPAVIEMERDIVQYVKDVSDEVVKSNNTMKSRLMSLL